MRHRIAAAIVTCAVLAIPAGAAASVIKAMLLVSYLRKVDYQGRRLTPYERRRLRRMIVVSSNDAATSVYHRVGKPSLRRDGVLAGRLDGWKPVEELRDRDDPGRRAQDPARQAAVLNDGR